MEQDSGSRLGKRASDEAVTSAAVKAKLPTGPPPKPHAEYPPVAGAASKAAQAKQATSTSTAAKASSPAASAAPSGAKDDLAKGVSFSGTTQTPSEAKASSTTGDGSEKTGETGTATTTTPAAAETEDVQVVSETVAVPDDTEECFSFQAMQAELKDIAGDHYD